MFHTQNKTQSLSSALSQDSQHMLPLFRLFDVNGDGFISRGELRRYLRSLFRAMRVVQGAAWQQGDPDALAESTVDQAMHEADLNSDGRISFEEFVAWISGETGGATARRISQAVASFSAAGPTSHKAAHDASSMGVPLQLQQLVSQSLGKLQDALGLAELNPGQVFRLLRSYASTAGAQYSDSGKTVSLSLTQEHFVQGMQAVLQRLQAPQQGQVQGPLRTMFARLDTNHDGLVDMSELAAALSCLCGGSREDKVAAAFDLYDADGDGVLSPQEVSGFFVSIFRLLAANSQVAGMLAAQGLEPTELGRSTALAVFAEADSNGDGSITREEFQAWYENQDDLQGSVFSEGASSGGQAPVGRPSLDVPDYTHEQGSGGESDSDAATEPGDVSPLAQQHTAQRTLDAMRQVTMLAGARVQDVLAEAQEHADEDGDLSREAFRRVFNKYLKRDSRESFAAGTALLDQLFGLFDADGNHIVDSAELAAGLTVLCGGPVNSKAQAAFELFDADGDGFISLEEMTDYLHSVFRVMLHVDADAAAALPDGASVLDLAASTAHAAFVDCDLNHDGQLSVQEFTKWFASEMGQTLQAGLAQTSIQELRELAHLEHTSVQVMAQTLRKHADPYSMALDLQGLTSAVAHLVQRTSGAAVPPAKMARLRLLLTQMFDAFAGEDGQASHRQLAIALAVLCGSMASGNSLGDVFEVLDADGDGGVSFRECYSYLLAVFTMLLSMDPGAKAAVGAQLGPEADEHHLALSTTEKVFMEADLNGDGRLSRGEFMQWVGLGGTSAGVFTPAPPAAGHTLVASAQGAAAVAETDEDAAAEIHMGVLSELTLVAQWPMNAVLETFAKHTNGDGLLSHSAFSQAMLALLRPQVRQVVEAPLGSDVVNGRDVASTRSDLKQLVHALFTAFDSSQDGMVDYVELSSGFTAVCAAPQQDKLDLVFGLLDVNGSGRIAKADMESFLAAYFKFVFASQPASRAALAAMVLQVSQDSKAAKTAAAETLAVRLTDAAFATADLNSDKHLSRKEFQQWYSRVLDRATELAAGLDLPLHLAGAAEGGAAAASSMHLEEVARVTGLATSAPSDVLAAFRAASGDSSVLHRAQFNAALARIAAGAHLSDLDRAKGRLLLPRLFAMFDDNGDGVVDFAEVALGMQQLCGARLARNPGELQTARVQAAFQLFDLNGDGFIERHEMRSYLAALFKLLLATQASLAVQAGSALGLRSSEMTAGGLAAATTARAFKEADTDGDGRLTQGEFDAWINSSAPGLLTEGSAAAQLVHTASQLGGAVPGSAPPTAPPADNLPTAASGHQDWAVAQVLHLTILNGMSVQEVLGAFAEVSNEEGLLTLPAFRAAVGDMARKDLNADERRTLRAAVAPALFDVFDSDNDGFVDFPELCAGMTLLAGGAPAERMEGVFALFDADSDGSITIDEMTAFLEGTFRMAFAQDPSIAQEVGGLGPEELAAATASSVFENVDIGDKGRLSKAEFQRWFQASTGSEPGQSGSGGPIPMPSAPPPLPSAPQSQAADSGEEDAGPVVPYPFPHHRNLANVPSWMTIAEARRLLHLHQFPLAAVLGHFQDFADARGNLTRAAFQDAFAKYVHGAQQQGALPSDDVQADEHVDTLIDALFDVFDEDDTGIIKAAELQGGLTSLVGGGSAQDRVDAAFDIYDVEGNGYLTQAELQAYLTHVFKTLLTTAPALAERFADSTPATMARSAAAQCFAEAGAEGTGRLSREGFHQWYASTQAAMGENGDPSTALQRQLLAMAELSPSQVPLAELRAVSCLGEFSVQEALQVFTRHADVSGMLSRRAFNAAMNKFVPHHAEQTAGGLALVQGRDTSDMNAHAVVRAHLFDVFDTTQSGFLDMQHLAAGLSLLCGGLHDARVRDAFAFIDTDGDGVITQAELRQYLTGMYRLMDATNGLHPGEATAQELAAAAAEECFAEADLDHTGRLTVQELIKWYAAGDPQDAQDAELRSLVVSAATPEPWMALQEVKRLTGLQYRRLPAVMHRLAEVADAQGHLDRNAFHIAFQLMVEEHETHARANGQLPIGPGGVMQAAEGPLDTLVAKLHPQAQAYHASGRSAVDSHRTHLLLDRLFDIFDPTGQGYVDFSTLCAGVSVLCGGHSHERATAVFELFDINGDGVISAEELFMYLRAVFSVLSEADPEARTMLGGRTPAQLAAQAVAHVFAEADLNHDGMLQLDEFLAWYGRPGPTQAAFVAATHAVQTQDAPPTLRDATTSAAPKVPQGPVFTSDRAAEAADELPPADELRARLGLDSVDVSELFSILREHAQKDNGRLVLSKERFVRALHLIADLADVQHSGSSFRGLCEHVYVAFDADGNGVLDFAEICTAFTVFCAGTVDDKVQAAFEAYDADGDGFIDRAEMYDYLVTLFSAMLRTNKIQGAGSAQEIARATTQQAFAKADGNKDDKLSFAEFRQWYSNMTMEV